MKRALSLILALTVCLSLAACGGEKAEEDTAGTPKAKTEQTVTVEQYYPFGGDAQVSGVARLGNNLLLCGADESAGPVLGLVRYSVESAGSVSLSETKMLALDEPGAVDEAMIHAIAAGGDGAFYVLTGEQFGTYKNPDFEIGGSYFLENPDYAGRYSVLRYSEDGELLERIRIRDWPHNSIEGIAVGNDGELVLYGGGYIALTDRTGAIIHEEEAGDGLYVQSVSLCGEGLIVSLHETSKLQGTYYRIDSRSGLLTQLSRPGLDEIDMLDTGSAGVTQGLDGEYILYDSMGVQKYGAEYSYRGLYRVDFEGETYRELYRLVKTGEPENCTYLCLLTEDAFVYTHADSAALFLAVRGAQSGQADTGRSVVKVALYGASDQTAQLDALNAAGGDCSYEYTVYSAEQRDLLMTEISTGNAPDLVLFSAGMYNGEPLDTNSDYFEDLYPYLDADPELSRDSFVPNLLDALSVDGRLTQLWTYVGIYTVSARTADVGDGKGLTPEDYIRILEGNENYTSVFFPFLAQKENILLWAVNLSIDAYTDKENASCSFDSGSFAELLRWINTVGSDVESEDFENIDISEVVAFHEQIITPTRIHAIGENYGEPFTLAGFPLGAERGHYYTSTDFCMAIPALGSNKEGAWELIRSQLILEAQYDPQTADRERFPKIPINFEAMQRLAHDYLTEEETQILTDLVRETKFVENHTDRPLREIIVSAAQPYFAGDKTLEETVALIQSRASVYMAEKYG
ncbi:MAG: hypothetical protein ACI4O5_06865 [Oscillospiraceae bacterium]